MSKIQYLSWEQANGYTIIRGTCPECSETREVFGRFAYKLREWAERHNHLQEPPQCPWVSPKGQCCLVKGHPTGPQYSWFTDHEGHIVGNVT